jgi:DNA gyrase subunit A
MRIIQTDLRNEMSRSYLEYAMSVIVGRALPDARDGLKPVHRRILYAMYELGLTSDRPYRKCARVVGEVLGKYHPHGDTAVYDALVRMAQDFSLRMPLIDGHGNFGSVDNDPPAAMRYTESRLQALTTDALLEDIESETVDFADNFDGSQQEPTVLPARIPQLLLNGSSGIAVGMATNIPPHNLGELLDGLQALIANPEITDRELQALIPGPDFPTGGQILGRSGIREIYSTGRGSVTMRGVAAIETLEVPGRPDRDAVIITELPYQTNKAALIERIAELVNDKKLDGISDIRDESDRRGMRIVIELKRGEIADVVLNNLYKHTPLQTSFGIIMLAIAYGRPRVLPLLDLIDRFVEFRREVVRRRTEFELRKAEARAHVLEGLRIALDQLDAVITLIRAAKSPAEAREGLMTQFGLSQIQAQAILDMQLQRLTGLERQKILDELAELLATIERLRAILGSDRLVMEIVIGELKAMREKFADPRRTAIVEDSSDLNMLDLIADEEIAITVSHKGYIKRTSLDEYRFQHRGGVGLIGMRLPDDDYVQHLFVASTHAYLIVFSDKGRAYWLRVYEIPETGRDARGRSLANLVQMTDGEKVADVVAVREFPTTEGEQFVVMGTRRGTVKKTDLKAYSNPRAGGIIAMGVDEDDAVIAVQLSTGHQQVLIGTRAGMAIRFEERDVRSMGRTAYGVRGIALRPGDEVVAMEVVEGSGDVLTVTAAGYGKRTSLEEYRLQGRGGYGIINIQASERNGEVVGVTLVQEDNQVMIITQQGKVIRMAVAPLRRIGRNTQGVRLIRLDEEDRVEAIARLDADATGGDVVAPPDVDVEEPDASDVGSVNDPDIEPPDEPADRPDEDDDA